MYMTPSRLRPCPPPVTYPSESCACWDQGGARVHFFQALQVILHLQPQELRAHDNGMVQTVGTPFYLHTEKLAGVG